LISLSPANGFLLLKNTNERKNDVTTFNLNFPISLEGQRLLIYRFSSTACCPNASSEKQHYCLASNGNAKERKTSP